MTLRQALKTRVTSFSFPQLSVFWKHEFKQFTQLDRDAQDTHSSNYIKRVDEKVLNDILWWSLLDSDNALEVLDSIADNCPVHFVVGPWLPILHSVGFEKRRLISYFLLGVFLFSPFLWIIGDHFDYSNNFNACIIHGCVELFIVVSTSLHDFDQTKTKLVNLIVQYLWHCCLHQLRSRTDDTREKCLIGGNIRMHFLREFISDALEDIWGKAFPSCSVSG